MTDATTAAARPTATVLGNRGWFLATILSSAFLLFLVQPMIARMALPRVGGAPAVWNSAMLVYQALLLGGYAYADALGRLRPSTQGRVHLFLLLAAAVTLPIGLLDWPVPTSGNIFLWVPWLFLASIGPLFFVMSAHAPLLQRWYAVRGHGDPYPLYAASNIGSFLGLAAYPLLVEPNVDIALQSRGWSLGYALVVLLVAGCALRLPAAMPRAEAAARSPAPSLRTMVRWALIAAVPSGLIMSTTLHLTTDIVAMPLLWVLPLGLYLLSFSVAFATDRRWADLARRLAPLALLIGLGGVAADGIPPYPYVMLAASLVSFFLLSSALHARLYDDRPAPEHLTRFYLVMSVGGALGGLFCALLAPMAFNWTYEHPLLLVAAAMLLPMANPFERLAALWSSQRAGAGSLLLLLALAALILASWVLATSKGLVSLLAIAAMLVGVAAIGRRGVYVAAVVAVMLIGGGITKIGLSLEPGRMSRSFFGVYAVQDSDTMRQLVHGTTLHGVQLQGSPDVQRTPTTYYVPTSGVGRAMRWVAARPGARVDVVGLGAGTLACYRTPAQDWRFYEIDPEIVDVAKDPDRFTFLSQCAADAPVVVGDARLTLAALPPGSSDLLVIDAFSSDSIPVHLLTREAFALYRSRLKPDGLLMVHISNRFMDLEPLLAAEASAGGWTAAIRRDRIGQAVIDRGGTSSNWVALSGSPMTIAALEAGDPPGTWDVLRRRDGFAPWTDGRSSILPLINW